MRSAFLQTRTARAVISVFAVASLAVPALSASAAGPQADLAVTIAGPASVDQNAKIATYNLTVSNAGPATTTRTSFKAVLPGTVRSIASGSKNIRSVCSGVSTTNASCQFIYPLKKTDGVQKFTVQVDVSSSYKASCTKAPPTALLATAKVASSSTTVDPNLLNNTSKASSTVNCPQKSADLSLSVPTVTPAIPVVGSSVAFNQIVANAGPDTPTNVTLTVTAPTGFIFNPSKSMAGCISQGTSIICKDFLPMGFFDITFDVPNTVACGSVVNYTATVSATEKDPILANNSRSVEMTVACPPPPTSPRMLGDVNNDGKLASADSTLIRRHLDGLITLTGNDFTAADVDQDGKIAIADLYLLRGAIGQMITLPAVYGDVNGDGKLTSDDTALVTDFASGVKTPTNRQKYLGDVNVNGKIDQKDVTLMSEAVQKLVVLPVLCGNAILNVETHEQCDDGNRVNNDGCSNMCVVEVLTQNELTITQKATASTDTAIANQKDVSLLRFEATADNEGIFVTSLAFDAKQGSLLNAQNYSLKVDTNGDGVVDTVLQSGVSPVSGVITFDNLVSAGFVIPATKTFVFEVRADIVPSFLSNQLQLKFATTLPAYIKAERVSGATKLSGIKTDGTCAVTCETTVTTTSATVFTLATGGNLYIYKSSTPVMSHQLLGGALSDDILRVSLRAESEDIDVTNLVFTAVGSDASTFSQNVSRLELYQVGASTPFAVASIGACGADPVPAYSMCAVMNSAELIVPKGSNSELLVRARMKSDLDGAVSGKKLTVFIDAVQGAKARGLVSGNFLSSNNGDTIATGETFIGVSSAGPSQTIVGKDHVVVMSKVLSIINADPNANGSAIPSGSSRAISQFKFTTASHGNFSNGMNKVVIDSVIYTVNASNVALDPSAFTIYSKVDPSMKASCSLDPSSTTVVQYVVCPNLSTSGLYTEIDAGSDATLVLEANVLSTQVNPSLSSSLQVSLQNFSDSTLTTLSVAGSHMRWVDKDNASSTPFLWMDSPETVMNGTFYQN